MHTKWPAVMQYPKHNFPFQPKGRECSREGLVMSPEVVNTMSLRGKRCYCVLPFQSFGNICVSVLSMGLAHFTASQVSGLGSTENRHGSHQDQAGAFAKSTRTFHGTDAMLGYEIARK
eukprot:1624572-Rhodomonas_salina.1